MNPRDIRPAVTNPIAAPWKGRGTSARAARSRNRVNIINIREKPIPILMPANIASMKLIFLLIIIKEMPRTAVLEKINGINKANEFLITGLVILPIFLAAGITAPMVTTKARVRRYSRPKG